MYHVISLLFLVVCLVELSATPLIGGEVRLNFITNAVTRAELGVPYVYDAQAAATATGRITYQLTTAPAGMTCDDSTGRVSWPTPTEGTHNVILKARADFGLLGRVEAVQNYFVTVVRHRDSLHARCALLHGTARLRGSGGLVARGLIQAWRVNDSAQTGRTYYSGIYTSMITDGQFAVLVPGGTYILRVSSAGAASFTTTYHAADSLASHSAATADRVRISCPDTTVVDVMVNPVDYDTTTTLTGRVLDAETELGLIADVTFTRVGSRLITVGADTIGIAAARTMVTTAADGSYSVELPAGRYIAMARAASEANGGIDYHVGFFDQQEDATRASIFSTAEITGDVSFRLNRKAIPDTTGSISGRVISATSVVVTGTVSAFRIDHGAFGSLTAIAAVTTDTEGRFAINDLPAGDYVLCIRPDSEAWISGYVAAGIGTVTQWQHATRLSVKSGVQHSAEIVVRAAAMLRGFGRIAGTVLTSASGSADAEVQGALVTCINAYGQVCATAFTDTDGSFVLDLLHTGEYTVVVDRVGLEAASRTVVITDANTAPSQQFVMDRVTSIREADGSSLTMALRPNPAVSDIEVELDVVPGTVQLDVITSTGTIAATHTTWVSTPGPLSINLPLNLPSGWYLVRLHNGGRVSTRQLIVQQ